MHRPGYGYGYGYGGGQQRRQRQGVDPLVLLLVMRVMQMINDLPWKPPVTLLLCASECMGFEPYGPCTSLAMLQAQNKT